MSSINPMALAALLPSGPTKQIALFFQAINLKRSFYVFLNAFHNGSEQYS